MKGFSSDQIKALNAKSTTGRFVEAAIFTRDMDVPDIKDYFINSRSIIFKGNTYTSLKMIFSGIKSSSRMDLPTNQVTVTNLGGIVIDYLEDDSVNIEENDVLLQILYIDKFNKISLIDEMLYQVEIIVADYHKSATINLGVNYSLNDIIPRATIETQEFPGIRGDVIRVGT